MPRSEQSLAITDEYRRRLARIGTAASVLTSQAWQRVNTDDLDGTYPNGFLTPTVAALEQLQRAGVVLTSAYMAAYVAAELATAAYEVVAPSLTGLGVAEHGAPLADALAAPLITVKTLIKQGTDRDEAMKRGQDRAIRLAESAALHAPRVAMQDLITTDHRLVGWRRVTGGGCGACLALANNITQPSHEPMHVHPHCHCTAEPVVRDVVEHVQRPSGAQVFDGLSVAQQDALLGDEKAKLVRDGRVPFHDLIQVDSQVEGLDLVTEAPLEALHRHE